MSWLRNTFVRIEDGLAPWVIRWRWAILACTALFLAWCGVGLGRLQVDNNTRVFFGHANPYYKRLQQLERAFSNEQHLVFIIHPKSGTVFDRQVLAVIQELTDLCWQIPYCRKVHSITNHPYIRVDGDELYIQSLVEDVNSLTASDLHLVSRQALADCSIINLLVSPTGHCTAIYTSLQLPGKDPNEVSQVARFAYGILGRMRSTYPQIDTYLTGAVIVDDAFGDAARQDLYRLAPVMLVVLTGLVGLALRSFWATVVTMLVISASMVTGLGLAGWLQIPINAASAGAPVLILTLSVADTVHLLATMINQMRCGIGKALSVVQAVRSNLRSIFLTNVTTIFGFSGVNLSESPPFRDLANMVNIGVGAAFIYAIILLPVLVVILPVRIAKGPEPAPLRLTRRLTNFSIRYHRPVLLGVLLVVSASAIGLSMIEFDDNYLTYLGRSYEFRQATDFMIQNLGGWDVIEYALPARDSGGITDPCYLVTVDRFMQWFRSQPKVRFVGSFVDVIKRINQIMNGNDPNYYTIPDSQELIAQYLLLYEMSLPAGHDLKDQVDVDRSSTRLMVLFESVPSSFLRQMEQKSQGWLADNAPSWMQVGATGQSLVWAHITERNVRSMFWGSLLSLSLVSLCLLVGLGSLKLSVVSLLPNLIPPVVAFAIWGAIFHQVGLGLSVVISMTIGIVVDDTIHFLTNYQEVRAKGYGVVDAIRRAFYRVGMAMWVMTVALVAGFSVLVLSHYRISVETGLICAMTFGIACWMDYLILPGALLLLDRDRHQARSKIGKDGE